MSKKSYLTTNEVAALLRVTPVTVRQWSQKGMLAAEYTLGGHRRFLIHEIERFATAHGISLPGSTVHMLDVLIVDGDEQACTDIVEQLSMMGHEAGRHIRVETANNCFEAGAKAVYFRPQYVLLDQAMIVGELRGVCDVLRKFNGHDDLQILVMSAGTSDAYDQDIYAAEDIDSLIKPVQNEALINALGLEGLSV